MLARHDLVWLFPHGWRALCLAAQVADDAPPARLEALDLWRGRDWPLTVRRRDDDAAADEICLGLTLPRDNASGPRTRVSLRVPRSHVRRVSGPPGLEAGDTVIAPRWAPAWKTLRRGVRSAGLDVRIYGSLGMEALTGAPYLTEKSDIDLLFLPTGVAQLEAGTALLWAGTDTLPLDGEIVFPSGRAVSWKEWRALTTPLQAPLPMPSQTSGQTCSKTSPSPSPSPAQDRRIRVLAKAIDSVALCTMAELRAEFGEAGCPG